MSISAEDLVDRVEALLRRQIGLRPESTLRGRLRRSMREEAAARDLTAEQLVDAVVARPEMLQGLLDRVTVQETGFFRHPEHFRVLAQDVLPALSGPVTLWSAASSNGQEAYSLAMVLAETGVAGTVVATDLSTSAVRRTAAGRYSAREMTGLSAARVARHFTRVGDEWQVGDDLRRRVTVYRHNLVDPIPDRVRGCQVVFCRNVLIYFAPEHATTFVDRVADALPAAAVFLGGAEAMWPISRRYETVRAGDTFWYRATAPVETSAVGARPAPDRVPTRSAPPRPPPTRPAPVGPVVVREPVRTIPVSTPSPIAGPVPQPVSHPTAPGGTVAAGLTRAGQQALDAGDHPAAVVAFRKSAYLTPDDPSAHLHLGLAFDAAGDRIAARRAYAAARRALLDHPPGPGPALGGYAPAELLRLLDRKQGTP